MNDSNETAPQRKVMARTPTGNSEVPDAKCRENACTEAAEKQCGRNGMPFMDDKFDEPGKPPNKS